MAIEAIGISPIGKDAFSDNSDLSSAANEQSARWRVRITDSLAEVEDAWRHLESLGIESPGQSLEFIKVWVEAFHIPQDRKCFIAVEHSGDPVAVFALERTKCFGASVLTPFPDCHVGINAPAADYDRLAKLSDTERQGIWRKVLLAANADMIEFPNIRTDYAALFEGLGARVDSETLYRTEFSSWEDCDQQQRTRSRRKHDKQQGAKLAARGDIAFEVLDSSSDADEALDIMFADRAARFAEQGIADPFDAADVRAFYRSIFKTGERLKGVMQVLKLDGKIVATRYNLVMADKMFCLISSMNVDPALQPGSPGKQILLRIMQSIFGDGIRTFDMGAGFSDEKRHWCNIQVPLSNLYLPTTAKGRLLASVFSLRTKAKAWIKANADMFELLKSWRARLGALKR